MNAWEGEGSVEEGTNAVEEDKSFASGRSLEKSVVSETQDAEDDGENRETHELNRLSSPDINLKKQTHVHSSALAVETQRREENVRKQR